MNDAEKKAHREGFLLAARSLFVPHHVFQEIERTVDDLGSGEYARIDRRQWEKMIRRAHASLAKEEAELKAVREQSK